MTSRYHRPMPRFPRILRQSWRRGGKLVRLLQVPKYRNALIRHRVAAAVELANVPLPAAATVLDVGGNRGQFALVALERFPSASVHSFEPLPRAFSRLEAIAAAEPRLRVHRFAVGTASATATFHVSGRADSSSLLPITERQIAFAPGSSERGRIEVEVRRLDEMAGTALLRPLVVKIDVQGGELEVLKGATRTLESTDVLLIECSFVELYDGQALAHEVIAYLADRGFHLAGAHDPEYGPDGRCIQADLLFERSASAEEGVIVPHDEAGVATPP